VYTNIPLPAPGIFWIPNNAIYVQSSVIKYQQYYRHVIEHEKKHYDNFNSDNIGIIKIIKDIHYQWCDAITKNCNKKIRQDENEYKKKWRMETKDVKVKFRDIIIKEYPPNRAQNLHAKLVDFFSPDSIILSLIFILSTLLVIKVYGLAFYIELSKFPMVLILIYFIFCCRRARELSRAHILKRR